MNSQSFHDTYLRQGTAGYAIIRRFHAKYADLLERTHLASVDDVVHDAFLALSKTDFSQIREVERYVMRAIKLHCWSLLDKAIRLKPIAVERQTTIESGMLEVRGGESPVEEVEGMELLAHLNLFKSGLDRDDARLLNLLIDESGRVEIAGVMGLNMNTLDTKIRRLRIRLAEHLKSLGYSYRGMERFE